MAATADNQMCLKDLVAQPDRTVGLGVLDMAHQLPVVIHAELRRRHPDQRSAS